MFGIAGVAASCNTIRAPTWRASSWYTIAIGLSGSAITVGLPPSACSRMVIASGNEASTSTPYWVASFTPPPSPNRCSACPQLEQMCTAMFSTTPSTGDRKSTRLNSSHTEIYTLSLHDALPILLGGQFHTAALTEQMLGMPAVGADVHGHVFHDAQHRRSEEHTSELQSHRDLHSFPTRRSSDLTGWPVSHRRPHRTDARHARSWSRCARPCFPRRPAPEIGRASCRERV